MSEKPGKPLSELSLEELWRLFPIVLKEHDARYAAWYEAEKESVLNAVGAENVLRISHFGSTAVKGLIAKPTVDILLEIDWRCDTARLTSDLEAAGWRLMRSESDPYALVFNKGYTPSGFAERVFHLHARYFGDWDELYFRDYLSAHTDIAREYGEYKRRLLKEYENDRDGYTDAKTEFIARHTQAARREFGGRYSSPLQE